MEKKQTERCYLDQFKKAYRLFPEGSINPDNREQPDFIVRHGQKTVGIELTRCFKKAGRDSTSIQAKREPRLKPIEKAREQFESTTAERYRVSVGFEEGGAIEKNGIDTLPTFISRKILEKIELVRSKQGFPVRLGRWDLHPYSHVVSSIHVYNHSEYGDYNWAEMSVFSTGKLNGVSLRSLVAQKNAKLESFQQCGEMWLLIVIDFWDSAMDQWIPPDFNPGVTGSKFNRIFLFKTAEEIVIEIQRNG